MYVVVLLSKFGIILQFFWNEIVIDSLINIFIYKTMLKNHLQIHKNALQQFHFKLNGNISCIMWLLHLTSNEDRDYQAGTLDYSYFTTNQGCP